MSMTFDQALSNAILAEDASAAFYRCLSHMAVDEVVRSFFLDMADLELAHAASVRAVQAWQVPGSVLPDPDEEMEDVERCVTCPDATDLSLPAAVELAVGAEEQAETAYRALAAATDGEIRRLFLRLADDEHLHATHLGTLLGR